MEEPAHRGPIGKIKVRDGALELHLWGHLGHDRHRELRRALRFVAGHASGHVVFDLATVGSIDRALVQSIKNTAARLGARGVALEVIPPAGAEASALRDSLGG